MSLKVSFLGYLVSFSPRSFEIQTQFMKGKNSEGKKQESMCFGIKNIYVSVLLLASRLGKLLKFFKPEFPLQNGVIN